MDISSHSGALVLSYQRLMQCRQHKVMQSGAKWCNTATFIRNCQDSLSTISNKTVKGE